MEYFILGTDVTTNPPRLILMTSRVFTSLKIAETYANNVSKAWGAFVVTRAGELK